MASGDAQPIGFVVSVPGAEVAPEAGTLVIFRSREMLHEVLATRGRRRLAITLWLFDTLSPSNIA